MNLDLYDNIFKRKSFHLFRNVGEVSLTAEELKDIENAFYTFTPLDSDIKVKITIEKLDSRGAEYAILMYSEKKNNYLENAGYLGEQLDLYCVSKNIGTLWYGIGKPDVKELDGLSYVIMILIRKVEDVSNFRKDMYKSKRKDLDETWHFDKYQNIGDIARFAPSACNSQPWDVYYIDDKMVINRKTSKRGIMPKNMAVYFNSIDMGIYLCFLDLCFMKNDIKYQRTMSNSDISKLEIEVCKYEIGE